MEIILELFFTVFIALVFSFLIAKIVSLAMGGGGDSVSGVEGKPLIDADDEIIMEELEFAEKLKVQGIESEKKVVFVKESGGKVDVFKSEQSGVDDQGFESEKKVECVEESTDRVEFMQETAEKVDGFEAEQARVVELKLDDILVEKKIEEIGEEIEAQNETKVQFEESQMKGLGEEEKEVKLKSYDNDDDWEGIEKSELEKVFGAAAKC